MSFFISMLTIAIFLFFIASMWKIHYEMEWEYIGPDGKLSLLEKMVDHLDELPKCKNRPKSSASNNKKPIPAPQPVLKELDFAKYADVPVWELEETISRDMEELDRENAEILRAVETTQSLKEGKLKRGVVNPAPKKPEPNNHPPSLKRQTRHSEINPSTIVGPELYDIFIKSGLFTENEIITEEKALLAIKRVREIEASDKPEKAATKRPKRRKGRPMPDMPGPKIVID